MKKLEDLGLMGSDHDTQQDFEQISAHVDDAIDRILSDLNTVYDHFEEIVSEKCLGLNCFIGISFLGIMDAEGVCYDEIKQDQGYHIISGVDKFKALFEVFVTVGGAPTWRFDAREYLLTAEQIREVETLIELDGLFNPLLNLIASTQGAKRSKPNKEFLPAGNWQTGLDMREAKLLGVYVQAMTAHLRVTMATNVMNPRKTDWTFGAAWLFHSYFTCQLGATPQLVNALPKANFVLEEQSVSSLENMLGSFL